MQSSLIFCMFGFIIVWARQTFLCNVHPSIWFLFRWDVLFKFTSTV